VGCKTASPDWFHGTVQHHLNSSAPVSSTFYGEGENQDMICSKLLLIRTRRRGCGRNLTEGWFVDMLPDMNTENPVVARYLLQNAIWWTEASGLDGFRGGYVSICVAAILGDRGTRAAEDLSAVDDDWEVFHPDASVTSFFAGGQKQYDGIDTGVGTVFDYPMYFVLRDVLLNGAPAGRIADVLRHDALYPRPEELVTFFGNTTLRALASARETSAAKLKLAFALTLTLRGIPQLYYGDEIGMTAAAIRYNRRISWRMARRRAKMRSRGGRTREQQEILAYVQALLAFAARTYGAERRETVASFFR